MRSSALFRNSEAKPAGGDVDLHRDLASDGLLGSVKTDSRSGIGPGRLDPFGNLAAYVDRSLLGAAFVVVWRKSRPWNFLRS